MMKIECRVCGAQYDYEPGTGASPKCACGSEDVHVIDTKSILLIHAHRVATDTAAALKRATEPFRHPRRSWRGFPAAMGLTDEEPEGPCPGCGRMDMIGSSTLNGQQLCQKCATKAMMRSHVDNRPRDERWGESTPVTAKPAARTEPEPTKPAAKPHREADRFRQSNHRQQVLSKIRMNDMRRRADELRIPG